MTAPTATAIPRNRARFRWQWVFQLGYEPCCGDPVDWSSRYVVHWMVAGDH